MCRSNMSVLSFLGNVNIAVRIVQEKHPSALLYEVDCSTDNGPTKDTKAFDSLRYAYPDFQRLLPLS